MSRSEQVGVVQRLKALRLAFSTQWASAVEGPVSARRAVAATLDELVAALAAALPIAPEETRQIASALFEELAPAIEGSVFAWRALHKPSGYSGDVLTMEAVYDGPRFDREGAPALLDACLTSLPPAHAVRNRLAYMARHVEAVLDRKGDRAHVISIGCGAARELVEVFTRRSERPRLTLIDLDPVALTTAGDRLATLGFGASIERVRANVGVLASASMAAGAADLVYSMGLMDYFPDDAMTRIIDWGWATLERDGCLIIGNFQPSNPAKIVLEMFLDWPLYYRDALDLDRVFRESTIGRGCDAIEREPSGVHLFAVQRKGGRA